MIAGNQAEQARREVQLAICDIDLRSGSNEVFSATHQSGHKRGTAEFTTMPKCNEDHTNVALGQGCRHSRCDATTSVHGSGGTVNRVGHEERQSACVIATGRVAT